MADFDFVHITRTNGRATVTVAYEGRVETTDDTHPLFNEVMRGVQNGDVTVLALFHPASAIADRFRTVSERISVTPDGNDLLFDGESVHNALASAILRGLKAGEDVTPLALFMERLANNPSRHSRTQAYDWLESQESEGGFTIDEEGYLIGYKGVTRNEKGEPVSVHSGTAFVNDEKITGRIPNPVGAVVSMARSDVQHDPSNGCSVGLHVGTWSYASNWGDQGLTLKVRVDPRDIVSVPTDCSAQKMRVSRYTVLDVIEAPITRLVDTDEDNDWDDLDDEDEWDEGPLW